jgi:hypothetical protein
MKLTIIFLGLLFAGIVVSPSDPAAAADMTIWRSGAPAHVRALPFPRSKRAQAVWASDACWRDCQAHCTWSEATCLKFDAQGRCLSLTDSCDRYCQRDCRAWGGPLLPIDF